MHSRTVWLTRSDAVIDCFVLPPWRDTNCGHAFKVVHTLCMRLTQPLALLLGYIAACTGSTHRDRCNRDLLLPEHLARLLLMC